MFDSTRKKLRTKTGDAALGKLQEGAHTHPRKRRHSSPPLPRLPRPVELTTVKVPDARERHGAGACAPFGSTPVTAGPGTRQAWRAKAQRPLGCTSTGAVLTTRQFKTCGAVETSEQGDRSS